MNIPSYSYCLGNLVSFLCNYMKLPLQSRHNLFVYDLCMNGVSTSTKLGAITRVYRPSRACVSLGLTIRFRALCDTFGATPLLVMPRNHHQPINHLSHWCVTLRGMRISCSPLNAWITKEQKSAFCSNPFRLPHTSNFLDIKMFLFDVDRYFAQSHGYCSQVVMATTARLSWLLQLGCHGYYSWFVSLVSKETHWSPHVWSSSLV